MILTVDNDPTFLGEAGAGARRGKHGSPVGDSEHQRPVETGPAHRRQLTHPLDTQVALHRHQLPDLVVDAVSPGVVLL